MPENSTGSTLPPMFREAGTKISDAEIVAEFPANTFLENITIDSHGNLYVTSLDEGAVYRISSNGRVELYAKSSGQLAGIVFLGEEQFLLNGWDASGKATIYLLRDRLITLAGQPEGAQFLNGICLLSDTVALICDSFKGCIWLYDLVSRSARIWLEHGLLSRTSDQVPMPAANGIKIFENAVYVSNTDKKMLVKIPLVRHMPGVPEIHVPDVNLDDFAFDEDGSVYATTHIYNSVIRIRPDKTITIIGEEAQFLAGSTALAFGRNPDDKNYIYVTTNGGMSYPPNGGIQPGRVVRLKIH